MVIQSYSAFAMFSQRQTALHTGRATKALEKLSSGNRLNRFSDNMVDFDRANSMKSRMSSLEKMARAQEAHALELRTFEGAMEEISSMANRMVDLSTEAASGTVSDRDRARMQQEVDAMADTMEQIIQGTKAGSSALGTILDKSDNLDRILAEKNLPSVNDGLQGIEPLAAQLEATDAIVQAEGGLAAAAAPKEEATEIPAARRTSYGAQDIIGLARSIRVGTQHEALASVDKAKQLAETASLARAAIGNYAKMAEKLGRSLEDTLDTLTEAYSTLADADMAKEMTEFTQANVLTQVSQMAQAHMLHEPEQILSLLQSMSMAG